MKVETQQTQATSSKLLVKKCHCCGHIMESAQEPQKCLKCKKSFLPVNYFAKVHSKSQSEYEQLFALGHEIHEDDLIKGLTVLW
jgi:ABC-type ATPase with predicted acetyltransferase domain